ncbi:MAG: TonB-dependent siderophore receptor [Burkholderiaceae bacterium]|nr:TonB-dependent siderophore receptor [Burkholderiaceae bacterium]
MNTLWNCPAARLPGDWPRPGADRGARPLGWGGAGIALVLAALGVSQVQAQARTEATATLAPVEVRAAGSGPAGRRSEVGGLSVAPLAETPQSVTVIDSATIAERGVTTLSGAIRGQSAVDDFYNTTGYVESVQVRGFVLDNARNFRRDGLPMSNHAPAAMENRERIEVLQGISGIQAGTSAPGGLINYVLKRPTLQPLRVFGLDVSERGSTRVHADLGGRAGPAGIGYRINLATERLHPHARDADGRRHFASGFFDWRPTRTTKLEAEFEVHDFRQPSVPGFGLLDVDGDGAAETLAGPWDPRLNLGSQPWSQPFESLATAGSLRFQQVISAAWSWGLRVGWQRIKTNDRIAFPDGCSSAANYVYPGFCGNGDFDLYDFRSENEKRSTRVIDAFAVGDLSVGGTRHELKFGVTRRRYAEGFDALQAYNWAGTSNLFNPVAVPAAPTPGVANTLLEERTLEIYAHDAIRIGERWSLWLGARHTRLERASRRTDGTEAVSYRQGFTTPWGAVGFKPWRGGFVYASAGSGVETEAVPNQPLVFTNYGQALAALRSTQVEVGLRQTIGRGLASATLFQIEKPSAGDVSVAGGMLTRVADGREVRHRGLSLGYEGRPHASLSVAAQLTFLDTEITRSQDATELGRRSPNTAPVSLSARAAWRVPGVGGLTWTNQVVWSGRKWVTADGSVRLPAYWQLDTALAYVHKLRGTTLTWRVGIDNLTDRHYWRDAPTQYWGGVYLFAALPRTYRASLQASF